MTPDDILNAYLKADAAPARDLAFEATVAERVARRRAIASVAALVPWCTAAAAGLWGLQPVLETLGAVEADLAPVATVLVAAGVSVVGLLAILRHTARG